MTAPDLFPPPMTLEESLRLYQQLLAKWPDRMPPVAHPDRDLWDIIYNHWRINLRWGTPTTRH